MSSRPIEFFTVNGRAEKRASSGLKSLQKGKEYKKSVAKKHMKRLFSKIDYPEDGWG